MIMQVVDNGDMDQLIAMLPKAMELMQTLLNKDDPRFVSQWYDLETCYKLRGAGALSTLKNNRYYQPKGGIPDAIVQGRKVWSKETVKEWISLTDDNLDSYHRKYHTGAKRT